MKDILKKDLSVLDINNGIKDKLKENEINFVYELCALNRKKLKEYKFKPSEINDIIVKLQLEGLDLGKKYKIK